METHSDRRTILQVSVVLAVRDERPNLAPLVDEIDAVLSGLPYEIVAVDDGSEDGSSEELDRLRADGAPVRTLRLRASVGQSGALCAGVDAARGEIIATLDADGQVDPAPLVEMINRVRRGECDAVVGVRVRRASGRWKHWQSRIANGFRNLVTGDRLRDSACSLRVCRRARWLELPRFDGMHRFVPSLIRRAGGRVGFVEIIERPRRHGRTHYGMTRRAITGVTDACGVRWLLRRPLTYAVRDHEENA